MGKIGLVLQFVGAFGLISALLARVLPPGKAHDVFEKLGILLGDAAREMAK